VSSLGPFPSCTFAELVDRYEAGDWSVCGIGLPLNDIHQAWRERRRRREETRMPNETIPEANVHWVEVAKMKDPHVEETKSMFILREGGQRKAVINWSGHDAREAQRWLKRQARRST
jgi:hypothetical protein